MPRAAKRNFNSNQRFVRKLIKNRCPELSVTKSALDVLTELEHIAFNKLMHDVQGLMDLKKPRPTTLTAREIEARIAMSFTNDLAAHLITAGKDAVAASKVKKETASE
jgi:hypothetical protein